MAIDSYVPNKSKLRILKNAFPAGDNYKIALYTTDPNSDVYTSRGEVTGKNYQAGGKSLSGYVCDMTGSTAYVNFSSPQWPDSSITASFALIYNTNDGNGTLVVLEFEETISKNGLFTVELPADGPTAILSL
jgi:hypothetical protein